LEEDVWEEEEEEESFSASAEDVEVGSMIFSEEEELETALVFLHPARSIDRTAREIIPVFDFFIRGFPF
jgi:hypothetical protein